MSKASLAKNPSEVAAMFDRVAAKYDITNDVLAFGLTHSWRRATALAVSAKKGETVLDLAAGTGTSSLAFSKSGATVIPCDFSLGMLREGRKRSPQLSFSAPCLQFSDGAASSRVRGHCGCHEGSLESI